MSSESDSDVFFDAEDSTPVRVAKIKNSESPQKDLPELLKQDESSVTGNTIQLSVLKVNEDDLKEAERKVKDNEKRRKKVEELRKQMLNEDDDCMQIHSEQSSLASSSFEGLYLQTNSNYASKKSEPNSNETSSVISLGKVGSILGGNNFQAVKDKDSLSTDSKYSTSEVESLRDLNVCLPNTKLSEPDVVASTKSEIIQYPIAPPRRKRRNKNTTSAEENNPVPTIHSELPSPSDPVESLTRELEYSLDLRSATRGQYVVKPQDREEDRAHGPSKENSELLHTEALGSESLNSITSTSSNRSTDTPKECLKGSLSESVQPYMVRTRSDSGRPLTDEEILAQVTVRNLDTGEQIPLSQAEEHLPKCLNPLSLHIMRLTSEYVSNTQLDKESDDENLDLRPSETLDVNKGWIKTRDFRKRFRMEVNKFMTVVDRVTHPRHCDDESEEEMLSDQRPSVKIKVSSKLKSAEKGSSEFESIRVVQEFSGEHTGAVWTMKFSACGRLLATAGQDHDLRIWVLKDAFKYFDDMRQKFNAEGKQAASSTSPEFLHGNSDDLNKEEESGENKGPFMEKPFCRYKGHTAEILDVSWSKNYFILSSSMDKTVRLWHISRKECLCCFQHIDFVTAIAFHPRDDRYFLSGSLDGKLRLWNIPDKKVTLWNELDGQTKLITAVNFCQNGKIAIVGSYDGRCIFYYTDQLKYYTQIHVRSTKGKNSQGRKISGIEAMPGEDKILVTSNDSRIRLYDLRDLCLTCKFKGYVNLSSQIKASFSHDGKYIISGSENQFIYIWKTSHDCAKFRRDRNDYWTGIKAHNAVVTSAVFAPNPALIVRQIEHEETNTGKDFNSYKETEISINNCYVMVSADFGGLIKVFLHKSKSGTSLS